MMAASGSGGRKFPIAGSSGCGVQMVGQDQVYVHVYMTVVCSISASVAEISSCSECVGTTCPVSSMNIHLLAVAWQPRLSTKIIKAHVSKLTSMATKC